MGRQRRQIRADIGRAIPNQPTNPHKRDAAAADTILLQCAAGAAGDLLNVVIGNSGSSIVYLMATRR
jgi:hypothetical protein